MVPSMFLFPPSVWVWVTPPREGRRDGHFRQGHQTFREPPFALPDALWNAASVWLALPSASRDL